MTPYKVSARRVASSRYLLALNAALLALYGLKPAGLGENYWLLFVPVIGVLVSVLWYWMIKSHADLNCIKFDLIHKLEEQLPAALYKYEWELAEKGNGKSYRAATAIEQWIPVLFIGLHVILGTVIVLAIFGIVNWTN